MTNDQKKDTSNKVLTFAPKAANFYTIASQAVKTTNPVPKQSLLADLPVQDAGTRQVVVITGRGQAAGRTSTLVRLRPDVVAEIKRYVDGPLYLTIELALRHYAKELSKREPGSIEMIRAQDLN